jgi:hypothetical protein
MGCSAIHPPDITAATSTNPVSQATAATPVASASPTPLPWLAPPAEFGDTRLEAQDADGRVLLADLLDDGTGWAIRDEGVRVTGRLAEPNRRLLIRDLASAYPDLSRSIVVVGTAGKLQPITLEFEAIPAATLLNLVGQTANVDVAVPQGLPMSSISVRSAPADAVADSVAKLHGLRRVVDPGLWLFVPEGLTLRDGDRSGPHWTVKAAGLRIGLLSALIADATGSTPRFGCTDTAMVLGLNLHRQPLAAIDRALAVESGRSEAAAVTAADRCLPVPWVGRPEELVGATVKAVITGEKDSGLGEAILETIDGRTLRVVASGDHGGDVEIQPDFVRVGGERLHLLRAGETNSVSAEDYFTHTDRFRISATVVDPKHSFALIEDRDGLSGGIPDGLRYRRSMTLSISDGLVSARREWEGFDEVVGRVGPGWPQASAPPQADPVRDLEVAVASTAAECSADDLKALEARRRVDAAPDGVAKARLMEEALAAESRAEECSKRLETAVQALREHSESDHHPMMEMAVSYSPLDMAEPPPAGLWFVKEFDEKAGWLRERTLAGRYSGDSWGDTLAIELDARLRKLDLRSRLLERKLDPDKVDALLKSDLTWECSGTIESLKVAPGSTGATLQVRYRLRREIQDELRVVQAGRITGASAWHEPPTEKDLRDLVGRTADALADRLVQQVPADALAGRN